jgi:hypothetical protein
MRVFISQRKRHDARTIQRRRSDRRDRRFARAEVA